MAKVQQKSEKISAFGGIFFVLDKLTLFSSHGDRHLGMGACFHGNFFAIFLMVS